MEIADQIALFGLAATWFIAWREMVKASELANFDFWIRDALKPMLEDLAAIGEKYADILVIDYDNLPDTRGLNRINNFSIRTARRYAPATFKTKLYLRAGDWNGESTLDPFFDTLKSSITKLQDSIGMIEPQSTIDMNIINVEFALMNFTSHIRDRICHGHGLFKWLFFRATF